MRIELSLTLLVFLLYSSAIFGQQPDSIYIEPYQERIRVMGFVGTDYLQIKEGNTTYTPNYPFIVGVGIAVKKTVVNVRLGYGLFPINSKEKYGKTKSLDLQLHNYWRNFIFDFSVQRYKGFYSEDRGRNVEEIFPDMTVLQAGGELTYVFNGSRFSTKAAFDQSEKQLQSAGSFLLGGETYFYRVRMDKNNSLAVESENLQLGVKAGYGYSLVLDDHWLLSAMGTLGVNFGNDPERLQDWKVKCYPAGSGRFGSSYRKDNWAVGMSVIIGNKQIYQPNSNALSCSSLAIQLSYVVYVDKLFKNKINSHTSEP